MGNQFVALPAPTGNGDGTPVDVSTFGALKTVICGGVQRAQITIEVNNTVVATDGSWSPIASFQNTGQWTGRVAARWMRVRVTGYNPYYGGTPVVEVGGTDAGTLFATLVAPPADGLGASVDVSALGVFKSVQVGAAFRGTTIIEVSEDGVEWAQPFSFQTPGVQSAVIAAHFMRVRRVGVPEVASGLPIVNIGATNDFAGAGDLAISAGTQAAETGTVAFGNSNGLSFGMQGSSLVTASMDAVRSIIGSGSTATGPTVSLANSNGVSFGVSGQTITASIAGGGVAVAAGTQTAATGTAVMSNSNGVSFGMAGSSQITASVAAIKTVSAGTTNVQGPGVSFANGSGVSFGANGSTITASVAPETPFGVSAGTQSVSTGTVSFANSNGVSFGMSGSNTVTASVAPETPFGISAGTQSVSTGTLVFSNSNGITFGMSGSSQVTASFSQSGDTKTFNEFNNWLGLDMQAQPVNQSSLFFSPRSLPNLAFSQMGQLVSVQSVTNSTGTFSYSQQFGFYTKNASTLSLLHSTSFNFTVAISGTNNTDSHGGVRLVTTPWTSTITKGDYWLGIIGMSASSSQAVTARMMAINTTAANSSFSGLLNQSTSQSVQALFGFGRFSAATAALPTSVAFSDIQGSVAFQVNMGPLGFALGSSF